jgi:hypothetical protein
MEPSKAISPMSGRDGQGSLAASDSQALVARVRELLKREPTDRGRRLVDARALAGRLGVEHQWVVDHARELGGVRLGPARGRLRFDLAAVEQHLACPYAQRHETARADANGPSR